MGLLVPYGWILTYSLSPEHGERSGIEGRGSSVSKTANSLVLGDVGVPSHKVHIKDGIGVVKKKKHKTFTALGAIKNVLLLFFFC